MKKRRQSRVLKHTITAFCVVIIHDTEISDEPLVLLVRNIADKDQKVEPDPLYDGTRPYKPRRQGKREGIGIPGGGQKRGDMESPMATAENELRRETGFIGKNLRGLFIQPKIILTDKHGEYQCEIPFSLGNDPEYDLPDKNEVTENVVCVYSGEVEWEGSKFQQIMHEIKRGAGLTPQDIREMGVYVWFDDLDEEEKASLRIEEYNEINMMGVFPLSLILEVFGMLGTKNRPDWTKDFYPSHIIRIAGACKMMGIWEDKFEEEFPHFEERGGTFIHTPYYDAIKYLSRISGSSLV